MYEKGIAEKLYLQLDKPYYSAGENIWFKGYLVNAVTLAPMRQSRYIYVELIDRNNTVQQRIKIRADEHGFHNCLKLPHETPRGQYTLRAYTQWMRNSGEAFFYNRILTIGNTRDTSTRYRFEIYQTTKNLMEDYWARGVGLGSDVMKKVFQTYPTIFDGSYPIHTHNNYLQMWGETGILGLLAFLALLLWQLKSGVKAFCAAADVRLRRLLAAAIGGFCGILVIGLAEYTWFYPRNMFTWWFLFGVIAACVKLAHLQKDKRTA